MPSGFIDTANTPAASVLPGVAGITAANSTTITPIHEIMGVAPPGGSLTQ
jgi:hypothetical protein